MSTPTQIQINYNTDLYPQFKDDLNACENLSDYKAVIEKYKYISPDLKQFRLDTEAEAEEFKAGLKLNRQGIYAGQEWSDRYATLLIPAYILHATVLAHKFEVTWGIAYLKMCEAGAVPGVDPEAAKREEFRILPEQPTEPEKELTPEEEKDYILWTSGE